MLLIAGIAVWSLPLTPVGKEVASGPPDSERATELLLEAVTRFHDAAKPVFEQLYQSVASGNEARITLEANSRPDYRQRLEVELKAIAESEMWRAGKVVRSLRPENAE